MRRRVHDEAGFTLVELLLTIAISAIVLTTITLAVAQGFSETSQAETRLDRSNLADFAANVFGSDAASSATTQPGTVCGVGPTALDIAESDGTRVSYAITNSAGAYRLERRVCDGVVVAGVDAVVRRLGATRARSAPSTAGSSCASGAAVTCRLSITWADGNGSFTLAGTRRAG